MNARERIFDKIVIDLCLMLKIYTQKTIHSSVRRSCDCINEITTGKDKSGREIIKITQSLYGNMFPFLHIIIIHIITIRMSYGIDCEVIY